MKNFFKKYGHYLWGKNKLSVNITIVLVIVTYITCKYIMVDVGYMSMRGTWTDGINYQTIIVSCIMLISAVILAWKRGGILMYGILIYCIIIAIACVTNGIYWPIMPDRQIELFNNNSASIAQYIKKNQKMPDELQQALVGTRSDDVIAHRLSACLGRTNIVSTFDGTGGWVYDAEKKIFGINVTGLEQYSTNFTEYIEMIKKRNDKKDFAK